MACEHEHPTNGAKFRPDSQTKLIVGGMYTITLGILCFLALQVWGLNGRMARVEVRQELRAEQLRDDLADLKSQIRVLTGKVDVLTSKVNLHDPKGD
jgi:hypothetical protein